MIRAGTPIARHVDVHIGRLALRPVGRKALVHMGVTVSYSIGNPTLHQICEHACPTTWESIWTPARNQIGHHVRKNVGLTTGLHVGGMASLHALSQAVAKCSAAPPSLSNNPNSCRVQRGVGDKDGPIKRRAALTCAGPGIHSPELASDVVPIICTSSDITVRPFECQY